MMLCSEVGERYLWVDALCILQDDGDDKLEQINAMDAVCSRAYAIIVAAATHDADGGLAPVNGSRVAKCLTQDIDSRPMVATTLSASRHHISTAVSFQTAYSGLNISRASLVTEDSVHSKRPHFLAACTS
ncbi:hypothetical protein F5Y18DRAFT_374643 [Xylariaceae sp. FL1019]|nr:hypothetical protein F5Y18DRAFT_374643 [Xylariaceae sp. FL1019]